jgi:hypothetical protein
MPIISKRDQERIRRYQEMTGETAKCFYNISISTELWKKILEKYQVNITPAEHDKDLNQFYWMNPDETVRILSDANPFTENKAITVITVFAKQGVIDWFEELFKERKQD